MIGSTAEKGRNLKTVISVKRGATLRRMLLWRNAKTRLPLNLTGQMLYGQVRGASGVLVSTIQITPLDQNLNTGKALAAFGDTSNWPLLPLYFDFMREVASDDGVVTVYSKTAYIKVERGITDV